ncbi:flavin reductase family protein [Streptomyces sp. NPDC089799]|uniref:flavin reductase family protein n=1 Tax=Streptomyces sp. NPDC089799 TaxID=3155066 RepID=UPI003415282C
MPEPTMNRPSGRHGPARPDGGADAASEADFGRFADLLDPPVYVVTVAGPRGREPSGCLVGFASQCSISPPRFMVWLSVVNHTYRVALSSSYLAVHVLDRGQLALAELFGHQTGDTTDKFDQVAWRPCGPERTPVLDDAAAWFLGRVREHRPAGDHVGFLLDLTGEGSVPSEPPVPSGPSGPAASGGTPLLSYDDVRHLRPGHPA